MEKVRKKSDTKELLDKLRRESPTFDNDLCINYLSGIRIDKKGWGQSMGRLLRAAYEAGERNSPANES